jgi:hypothetical protein
MANHIHDSEDSNFEITSKRCKGFPSETQVKRGVRMVHGNKELFEKLGRNDLCPCGSGRGFQELLSPLRTIRWRKAELLFSASNRAQRIGRPSLVAVRQHLRAEERGLSLENDNPTFTDLSAVPNPIRCCSRST